MTQTNQENTNRQAPPGACRWLIAGCHWLAAGCRWLPASQCSGCHGLLAGQCSGCHWLLVSQCSRQPSSGTGCSSASVLQGLLDKTGTDRQTASGTLRRAAVGILLSFMLLAGGCKSLRLPDPPVQDVTPQRERRAKEAAAQFDGRRSRAQLEAAQAAWSRGDLAGCREATLALLERDPANRDARLLLAGVYSEQNQSAEALQQLQRALDNHPRDPEVHNAMGVLLEEMGRPAEALACYQRAAAEIQQEVVIQAGHAEPVARAEGEPAGAAKGAGGADRSDRAALADSISSSAAENLNGQGEAALAQGRTDEAMALFADAAAHRPNDPRIPTAAAVAALRVGRAEVAAALADGGLRRFPRSSPLHRVLASAHYRLGQYEAAQRVLQQALSLDKSDALAYFLMGCTLAKLGQPDAAQAHFLQARRLSPKFAFRSGEAGFGLR